MYYMHILCSPLKFPWFADCKYKRIISRRWAIICKAVAKSAFGHSSLSTLHMIKRWRMCLDRLPHNWLHSFAAVLFTGVNRECSNWGNKYLLVSLGVLLALTLAALHFTFICRLRFIAFFIQLTYHTVFWQIFIKQHNKAINIYFKFEMNLKLLISKEFLFGVSFFFKLRIPRNFFILFESELFISFH